MNLFNTILVGFKEVWSHKFRSLLTMLGIILGVASLVGMAAIIKGMENGMKETMIAMGGADKVLLGRTGRAPRTGASGRPGARPNHGRRAGFARKRAAAPARFRPRWRWTGVTVTRGRENGHPVGGVGVWPAVLEMNLHTLEHGRFFTDLDEENANPVCVIGTGIRDELFGSPEKTGREIVPLGEIININGQPFTIVGMFAHYEGEQEKKERELAKKKPAEPQAGPARREGWGRGNWAFWRKNYTLYMPLNTAWMRFRVAPEQRTAFPTRV